MRLLVILKPLGHISSYSYRNLLIIISFFLIQLLNLLLITRNTIKFIFPDLPFLIMDSPFEKNELVQKKFGATSKSL